MKPLQNLAVIEQIALDKENENDAFKYFLRAQNNYEIDNILHGLNDEIAPQIDCTTCGNCCRSLMINVERSDAERLSKQLEISTENFYDKFIETSSSGNISVMNKIPCHFLCDNRCTVYEARPNECREFPGLHLPNFQQRIFATFMHYARCPIVFNVIETMKEKLEFVYEI